MTCCKRRPNDGTLDRVEIDRAVDGLDATISTQELRIVAMRLNREKGFGLKLIAAHTGFGNSTIGAILAKQKRVSE